MAPPLPARQKRPARPPASASYNATYLPVARDAFARVHVKAISQEFLTLAEELDDLERKMQIQLAVAESMAWNRTAVASWLMMCCNR
jgi:hypothetical protein